MVEQEDIQRVLAGVESVDAQFNLPIGRILLADFVLKTMTLEVFVESLEREKIPLKSIKWDHRI